MVAYLAGAGAALALVWIAIFAHVARANAVLVGETTLTSSGSGETIGVGTNRPVFQGDATARTTR